MPLKLNLSAHEPRYLPLVLASLRPESTLKDSTVYTPGDLLLVTLSSRKDTIQCGNAMEWDQDAAESDQNLDNRNNKEWGSKDDLGANYGKGEKQSK